MHIVHVGNMANKGTQALLKSDIYVLRDVFNGNVTISVSTTDVEGVKQLNLSLDAVLPPLIDIPYERADAYTKKLKFTRTGVKYKVFALGSLILMFIQALMSVCSAVLVKLGLRGFYRADVLENMKNSHIVVSCSDENFKEAASYLPLNVYWVLTWWSMLFSRTWDILIAKFLGKRVVMFPNSIGPFRTKLGLLFAKLALNICDFILVRDPISYRVVNSLRIKSPRRLASDTTLLLTGTNFTNFNSLSHPWIGVSPGFYSHSLLKREADKYVTEHAKALDEVIERYGFYVVFLPHYVSGFEEDDLEVSKRMLQQMSNKKQARIVELGSVEEFKAMLENADMVISSKMHPAVLATSAYVPVVCIAYDQKQVGYFNRLGLDDCVILIRDVSKDNLVLKINHVWNNRKAIKSSLQRKIPSLKADLIESIKIALEKSR